MRRSSGIFLLVAVFGLTGCRLLDMSLAGTETSLDESALSALRARLRRDTWKQNRNYDLLTLTAPPTQGESGFQLPPRWRYDDQLLQSLLDGLDRRAERSSTAPFANDYLRILAAGDDLVAWNAAILLAQRDDRFAVAETGAIKKLFLQRVTYDSNTGQLIQLRRRSSIEFSSKDKSSLRRKPSRDEVAKSSLRDLIDLSKEPPDAKGGSVLNNLWNRMPANPLAETPTGKETKIPVKMQNAAAEAYGRAIANAEFPSPLELNALVRLTRRVSLPMSVRMELMRAAARRVSPSRIPLIANSILPRDLADKHNRESRKAAVEACLIHAMENRGANQPKDFPTRLRLAAEDKLPEIRALYGRWAVFGDREMVHTILSAQLDDPQPVVRDGALYSYGLLRTTEAKRMLISRASHKLVDVRIAALHGLTQWQASDLVRFLKDENPQVRRELATVVAKQKANPGAGKLLQMLLDDPNRGVQMRCIESTDHWHDDFAIPVLLKALSVSHFITAESAWKELKKRRREIRGSFPFLKTRRKRVILAAEIAQKYNLQTGRNWPEITGRKFLKKAQELRLRGEFVSVLTTLRNSNPSSERYQLAVQFLYYLNPLERPILDDVIMRFDHELPRRVHEKVLSLVNKNYLYVYQLRHHDPLVRRQAAANLAKSAKEKDGPPLTAYIAHEMARLVSRRRERDVFRSAMLALISDASKENRQRQNRQEDFAKLRGCRRLAIYAAQYQFADVQVLACRYFRTRPHPTFGDTILTMMNKGTPGVRLAAVRAAGYCRHPDLIYGDLRTKKSVKGETKRAVKKATKTSQEGHRSPRRLGLLELMADSNRQVANEAIFSLVRLDHDAGFQAIKSLTSAGNEQVRIQAYTAIGESGRTRFIGHLKRRREGDSSAAGRKAIDRALQKLNARKPRRVETFRDSGYDQDRIATPKRRRWSDAERSNRLRYDDRRLDGYSTRQPDSDFTPPPGRRR